MFVFHTTLISTQSEKVTFLSLVSQPLAILFLLFAVVSKFVHFYCALHFFDIKIGKKACYEELLYLFSPRKYHKCAEMQITEGISSNSHM